jgi:hypothetical protein
VLLYRGGAAIVEAQERLPRLKQVEAIRKIYRAPFEYQHGQSLDEYAIGRRKKGNSLADVVLFAGVLYHMFDPFAGLCRVRGLAAKGGIVIIETAAVVRPDTARPVLYFNDKNSLSGTSTYFVPSPSWLDAALRYVGLIPLDCTFIRYRGASIAGRICISCRVDHPPELINPEKKAWERDFVARDFGEFLDLQLLPEQTTPVEYDSARVKAAVREDGSVDVARTVAECEPRTTTRREVTLMLADRD